MILTGKKILKVRVMCLSMAMGTAPEAVGTGGHRIGVANVWSILSLTSYNPESYSNLLQ